MIEQILSACASHGVQYRTQLLDRLHVSDITLETIPLFVRCADPLVLSWSQALVHANRPYAYYIDDNFWRIEGHTPLAAYYRHPLVRATLKFAVSHAQSVVTNSVELAKFLSRFNDRVAVLPTFFDFSLIEDVRPVATDEVRIGFAGSPSRIDDLELVTGLIDPILEKFPKAAFEFAGVLPRGVEIRERVRFFPHTNDYKSYIKFQAERNWAIGLAPLLDHEANRGKTDNKYREYGACHIAGIYSDIPPYSSVVQHSVTGILVKNDSSSWFEVLVSLVGQRDKQKAIADAAFKHVKARYDVTHVSYEWAEFFKRLASDEAQNAKPLEQSGLDAKRFWRRIERIRLLVAVTYEEGGFSLVIRRILRRIMGIRRGTV
ncbi:glycosyltransferase family 1 protein [Mesorhizobium sp. VK9D]|uniref:glycosyltransferase family 1 protein n=1 Tax=Mesorhizobium australafricanum TaxID=3072311 RepID=UPI002A247587|nr:glycosyltransferase family 1 protein [Mesorhizobium sp. VK9D]MDX8451975.1 glycosyltransferase family 1 protein [Mesorhizobium sp. VK9D]